MEQKEIITKYGARRQIAKDFGISEVSVRAALKGRTKSDLARKIRHVAVKEFGGKEV